MSVKGRKPLLTERQVLEILERSSGGLGFNELFTAIGKGSRTTLHGILATLWSNGFLELNLQTRKYQLTGLGEVELKKMKGLKTKEMLRSVTKTLHLNVVDELLKRLPEDAPVKHFFQQHHNLPCPPPLLVHISILTLKDYEKDIKESGVADTILKQHVENKLRLMQEISKLRLHKNMTARNFYNFLRILYGLWYAEWSDSVMDKKAKGFDWDSAQQTIAVLESSGP